MLVVHEKKTDHCWGRLRTIVGLPTAWIPAMDPLNLTPLYQPALHGPQRRCDEKIPELFMCCMFRQPPMPICSDFSPAKRPVVASRFGWWQRAMPISTAPRPPQASWRHRRHMETWSESVQQAVVSRFWKSPAQFEGSEDVWRAQVHLKWYLDVWSSLQPAQNCVQKGPRCDWHGFFAILRWRSNLGAEGSAQYGHTSDKRWCRWGINWFTTIIKYRIYRKARKPDQHWSSEPTWWTMGHRVQFKHPEMEVTSAMTLSPAQGSAWRLNNAAGGILSGCGCLWVLKWQE